MNESTLMQLRIIVERAVRPVQASPSRKRKMREELLGHVVGVFEQELGRLNNEASAIEQTSLRFGNPADATRELQGSVPATDIFARLWEGRPDDSALRGALRLAFVFQIFVLFVCGIALLVTTCVNAWTGDDVLDVVSSWFFVPQFSFGPLWLCVIALVAHLMQKSLHGPEPLLDWPRIGWRKSFTSVWAVPVVRIALIVGSLSLLLVMGVRIANWSTEPEDWERGAQIAAGVFFTVDLAATSVFAAWVLVQSADERQRYHATWANLNID